LPLILRPSIEDHAALILRLSMEDHTALIHRLNVEDHATPVIRMDLKDLVLFDVMLCFRTSETARSPTRRHITDGLNRQISVLPCDPYLNSPINVSNSLYKTYSVFRDTQNKAHYY
jgi:hypothetical protein